MTAVRTAPGPRSYRPIGDLPAIQRDPLRVFMEARTQYGDAVRFRSGPFYMHFVVHPDGVNHILHDNWQNYGRGYSYRFLEPAVGQGLLTSEGQLWLRQRRLAQPAFHRDRLAFFVSVMADAALGTAERWEPYARSGQPVDVSGEMMRLALEIVSRTLLGSDVTGRADAVREAVSVGREYVYRRVMALVPAPSWLPTPTNLRFRRAMRTLDDIVYGMIEARRNNGADRDDLLSMLLEARDEETGEGMSDKQLRDEVFTMFTAGHETTAAALAWTWYLLSQHPEAEGRLHNELGSVLSGRTPGLDDLQRLPYTRMVIEETLRLYPPVWSIGRMALREDTVLGYRIPAKGQVLLSSYVTHRHPEFWDEPERFDPERFAPERAASRPRYAYFPFGGGPRQCIGNEFAMMEAQLALATLAQRYRLRLVPGQVVEPEPAVTLRPRHGVMVTVEARS